MRALEQAAFDRGVLAEALMDEAGESLGRFLAHFFSDRGTAVAYLGKGNNGGDALVALRVLRDAGWRVGVRTAVDREELAPLPQRKWDDLGEFVEFSGPDEVRQARGPLLLIDGLLGIGAHGPVRTPLRELADEMNFLRAEAGARVAAVDIPSGVDADTGEVREGAVRADVTCVIAVGKPGLVREECLDHVGRLELIPLAELPPPENGPQLITPRSLRSVVPRRAFHTHKGEAGRVGIVAGSRGFLGAAVLCSLGALRGGAGLVTLYVPENLYPVMVAAGCLPEVMIKPVASPVEALDDSLDVLALGPGVGGAEESYYSKLLECIDWARIPVILDADGLNLVARERPGRAHGGGFLLTPHPGEMARLLPNEKGDRACLARAACEIYKAPILFKGARTIVTAPGEDLHYNTTGSPGMATGGQGDLLTGLLAALVAGGASLFEAARAGAWLTGRAAEIALGDRRLSEESLLPSDLADYLGRAFRALREEQ